MLDVECSGLGKHLDPRLVEIFSGIEKEVEEIGKTGQGSG